MNPVTAYTCTGLIHVGPYAPRRSFADAQADLPDDMFNGDYSGDAIGLLLHLRMRGSEGISIPDLVLIGGVSERRARQALAQLITGGHLDDYRLIGGEL